MNPADALRSRVVTTVVRGILGLAVGLYALIGYLLIAAGTDAVPDALWLAAGGLTGALTALLVNSKGTDASPVPVTVEQPYNQPVPVSYDDAGATDAGLLIGILLVAVLVLVLYVAGVRL